MSTNSSELISSLPGTHQTPYNRYSDLEDPDEITEIPNTSSLPQSSPSNTFSSRDFSYSDESLGITSSTPLAPRIFTPIPSARISFDFESDHKISGQATPASILAECDIGEYYQHLSSAFSPNTSAAASVASQDKKYALRSGKISRKVGPMVCPKQRAAAAAAVAAEAAKKGLVAKHMRKSEKLERIKAREYVKEKMEVMLEAQMDVPVKKTRWKRFRENGGVMFVVVAIVAAGLITLGVVVVVEAVTDKPGMNKGLG